MLRSRFVDYWLKGLDPSVDYSFLVGGFNPFEKYDRQIGSCFPKVRGENKKIFETTSKFLVRVYYPKMKETCHVFWSLTWQVFFLEIIS